MRTSKQPKKRIVLDLTPDQHEELSRRAEALGTTISNMVRMALHLPSDVKQGTRNDLIPKKKV